MLGTETRQTQLGPHGALSPAGEAEDAQTLMNNTLNNDKQAASWEGTVQEVGRASPRGLTSAGVIGWLPEDECLRTKGG